MKNYHPTLLVSVVFQKLVCFSLKCTKCGVDEEWSSSKQSVTETTMSVDCQFQVKLWSTCCWRPFSSTRKTLWSRKKKKKRKTVTTLSFLVAKRCSLQSKLNFPQKKSTLRVSPEQHRCFLLKYHGVPSPSVLDSQLFALKKESVWKSWNLCFQCSRMWKISSTIYKTQRKREINLLFFKSLKLILLRCCFKQAFGGVIKEKLPRGNKVSNTLITTSTTCVCSCLKLVGVCWCESLGKAFSLPKP